jgi:hypothetical protein
MLLADAVTPTITSVLTQLTEVFTWLIGKIGDLVTVIMAQPLLLIPIGITLSYVVVRFFKMLFSLVR